MNTYNYLLLTTKCQIIATYHYKFKIKFTPIKFDYKFKIKFLKEKKLDLWSNRV